MQKKLFVTAGERSVSVSLPFHLSLDEKTSLVVGEKVQFTLPSLLIAKRRCLSLEYKVLSCSIANIAA